MNFYMTFNSGTTSRVYAKILLKLKLTFIILFSFILQASATPSLAQITLNEKGTSLEVVIQKIRKQTGYDFFYSANIMNNTKPVTLKVNNVSVEEALKLCFANQSISYKIDQKTIVLQSIISVSLKAKAVVITGRILDEFGKPAAGVSIKIKGSKEIAISNEKGEFKITAPSETGTLVISYIGYKTQEIEIKANQEPLTIKLEVSETEMKDVVITGMMERKKESFTGAAASFNLEQLKAVGNTNVIQSLRTLDPSFLLMENNVAGANPNILPTIELRGQTSITTEGLRDEFSNDPNQPLFILDGFPTTLRNVVDLDINRISSITILKDAASTALYGSRASNGVIVIETIRPKAGEINVNYSTDANVELPDLNSYNMMNAREKLEFERLSGRYIIHPRFGTPINQMYLDNLYADRLKSVEQGVDSYWLNEPLQTGYSQRHSFMVNGGSNELTFGVGADLRNTKGAMIGSERQTWGTRLNLTYRTPKLSISNMLYVNGYTAKESEYGDFSKWVNANPYYDKNSASGRYLQEIVNPYSTTDIILINNPYYDSSLNSFDKSKNYALTNNFQARYELNNSIRFTAGLQINKAATESNVFVSPLANTFVKAATLEKGSLLHTSINTFGYIANLAANYNKLIGKSTINAELRGEISDKENIRDGYKAVGFPNVSNGNPRFAYGFVENGAPISSKTVNRRNSLISSINYSYDRRYNFDASFTYDGTTSFGSENLYSPFYSVGTSWNIHNEAFMRNTNWIDLLRVRGNIGITGNQNFSSYTSITTYNYDGLFNGSGQGAYLKSLGNTDLKWQNTVQTSLGIDANFFKNRLTTQFNAYRKYTDPLVVAVALPPSTALNAYPINAGNLTVDGIEAIIKYAPIYRIQDRIVWTLGLTASTYKQTYNDFNNILEGLNESLRKSKSLIRYRDGGDPADIWAVPSLGIDPATGREIFLKKDGTYTLEYDYKDQVVVGNTRPKMEGVFSSNLNYKGFNMSLNFRYSFGQDIFNSALFNKVENISMGDLLSNNQDKRALYDRWRIPGDMAEFKNISLTDLLAYQGIITNTEMSSRFVQPERAITLESASLGYEFRNFEWMKKARLSSLRLTGYANDIFRLSNVKRERGIDYPYAKTVSFSLSANFQ